MIIRELSLKHFGKFHDRKIPLSPGINIIYGDNESGKTTVHSFIRGMFLGIEKPRGRESKEELYSRYLPWDTKTLYSGSMDVSASEKQYRVYRNFYKDTKELKVLDLDFGREIPTEIGRIPSIFGRLTKANFRNTISLEQNRTGTDKELAVEVRNYMANLSTAKSNEVDVDGALGTLRSQRREKETNGNKEKLLELERRIEELPFLERKIQSILIQLQEEPIQAEDTEVQTKHEKGRKFPATFLCGTVLAVLIGAFGKWKGEFSIEYIKIYGICVLLGVLLYLYTLYVKTNKKKVDFEGAKETQVIVKEQRKLERLEWELELLETKANELETLKQEYEEWKDKKAENDKEIKAINLAIKTIEELSLAIHDNFGVQLTDGMNEIIDQTTYGKYDSVFIDEDLKMKVACDERVTPVENLSTGTIDQFYLALRLASGKLLLSEEEMPIILDDSFVFYDKNRLEAALDMLQKQERQIILFTCYKREKEILDRKDIAYRFIEL